MKWIFLLIKCISPHQKEDTSSSSIRYILLIKWISPPCQLYFSPLDLSFLSSGFLLIINLISPPHKMDFSYLSIGLLLIINWISPQHRMNFSSSSIAFLLISWISFRYLDFSSSLGFLLINWISPHHQFYFPSLSIRCLLIINWISPPDPWKPQSHLTPVPNPLCSYNPSLSPSALSLTLDVTIIRGAW